jgi:hypothetical protein
MTKEEFKDLVEILDFLASGLDNAEMTPVKYKFYFAALSDLSIDEIKTAANVIARNATFFPKPVDFRNALEGNIEDRATQAWLKALNAQNKYDSVCFDDPVIHSTIEAMGGWIRFCSMEGYTDEKWQMTDFIKIYKSVASRPEHPAKLQGVLEIENSDRGYIDYIPDVKLIGDQEKARLLLEGHQEDKSGEVIKKLNL